MRKLAEGFVRAGYTSDGIRARSGETVASFKMRRKGRLVGVSLETALDVLIRLNLDHEYVSESDTRLLDAQFLRLLTETRLIMPAPPGYIANSIVYPINELLIVSDRAEGPDDTPFALPEGSVYWAANGDTERLIDLLPRTECDRMLELCGGAGAMAIAASHRCRKGAWSADILDRCTEFARFNAALNGHDKVIAVTGDLYSAVSGLQFDVIAVHPPYVPQLEAGMVYRDGGSDGESILRRVVEDSPGALAPGGRVYIYTLVSDRSNAPAERRIREWLGHAGDDFDVLLVESESFTPAAGASAFHGAGNPEQLMALFEQLGVRQFVRGLVVLQRHTTSQAAWTLRLGGLALFTSDSLERCLRLCSVVAQPDWPGLLREKVIRISPGAALQLSWKESSGRFEDPVLTVSSKVPVPRQFRVSQGAQVVLSAIDGELTASEVHESLRKNGVLDSEIEFEDFARMIGPLVSSGVIDAGILTVGIADST
jgi:methylase of polypeptide subunit release factors